MSILYLKSIADGIERIADAGDRLLKKYPRVICDCLAVAVSGAVLAAFFDPISKVPASFKQGYVVGALHAVSMSALVFPAIFSSVHIHLVGKSLAAPQSALIGNAVAPAA